MTRSTRARIYHVNGKGNYYVNNEKDCKTDAERIAYLKYLKYRGIICMGQIVVTNN